MMLVMAFDASNTSEKVLQEVVQMYRGSGFGGRRRKSAARFGCQKFLAFAAVSD